MSTNYSRLVRSDDLPDSLWDRSNQVLLLSPSLVTAYGTLLDRHGLRNLAMQSPPPDGPVGGLSKEDTDKHLAWGFPGSAARVQLAMLDPKNHVPHIADAFTRLLAGNKVAITDVPCGSGAAVLSILATLAELRKQERVPRQPLDLVVVTGEISEFARRYAAEGFGDPTQVAAMTTCDVRHVLDTAKKVETRLAVIRCDLHP